MSRRRTANSEKERLLPFHGHEFPAEGSAARLLGRGLAQRRGGRAVFARDLIETLRQRELAAASRRLSGQTGLEAQAVGADGAVAGTYRQRLTLASGRFAMIDNGLGFTLVPWRPDLERHLGRHQFPRGHRDAGMG